MDFWSIPINPERLLPLSFKQAGKKKLFGLNSFKLLSSHFERRQIITSHLHLYRTYVANNKT